MGKAKAVWWVLSPTRMIAKKRIGRGDIGSAASLRAWNFKFQIITALLSAITFIPDIPRSWLQTILYGAGGYFALGRANELLFAFYSDALDRLEGKPPRIPLTKTQRINLLATGYIETVVLFGLIHLSAQALSPGCGYSKFLHNAFEASYFSAMTITTTGFGDITPDAWLPRLMTMYEAVIGIVFLALALASYLSFAAPSREHTD